jgi:hypothetical protein
MRSRRRWALTGLVALIFAGCGSAANRSSVAATAQATSYAQATNAACNASGTGGKPVTMSCVFVLADGRRFSCPQRFANAVETASSLERSRSCRAIAPLHLSPAVRRLTAVIESAQACFARRPDDRRCRPAATGHPEQPRW